jgi:predicted glycosyltransferase
MNPSDTIRVLMYSHDTYGLGHLTRTTRIARALRAGNERVSILILTGSPIATFLPLPQGTDLVKMPAVIKSGPDEYRSRDLMVSFSRIKKIRRDLIRGTAEAYRPHVFMVDNVPLGMKGEILPTLEMLRTTRPSTRIVLNLRDVLDDPSVIRDAWTRDGAYTVLDRFYDRIFVLGDPAVHDAVAAYGLPTEKSLHVGYAAPAPRSKPGASRNRRPRVVLTAGGGGDGTEFMRSCLDAMVFSSSDRAAGLANDLQVDIVAGPLMDPAESRALSQRAGVNHMVFHGFVPDLPMRMARADLVVAMAGYNTCCEILSHARAAVVYPRIYPRREQWIRADALARRGLVTMMEHDALDPDSIRLIIRRALECGPTILADRLPGIDGLGRLAAEMNLEFQALGDRTSDRARSGRDRTPDAVGRPLHRPKLNLARSLAGVRSWAGPEGRPAAGGSG